MPQYLARLAGRGDDRHQRRGLRPHDLRPRHAPQADRDRRGHGQRRLRRAGRRPRRATRSRRRSGASTSSPRPAATTAASSAFPTRSRPPSTWPANAFKRDGKLSGIATGPDRSRPHDGRPAAVRSRHPRRPSRHGQDRARHQHRLQHRQGLRGRDASPTARSRRLNGGIVGFFSLEMSAEQLATRIIAEQSGVAVLQDPPRRHHARTISTRSPMPRARCSAIPFYIDQTGGISIAQLAARARRLKRQRGPRPARRRLPPASRRLRQEGREPGPGTDRDHHRPEGAGQGARVPDHRALAAFAPGGTAATTSARSSRTCANRARSSRTPTWSCSSTARNIT